MMLDMETAGTVSVPIWLAWVGAVALAVSLLLAIQRAGGFALISSLFRVGLIAVGVLALWLYVEERGGSTTRSNPGSERRSLDDRKAALMAGAITPGSALSCLDEIAGEIVEARCEKAVFASPEAVAADVNYVMSQLALLNDGTTYAERGDATYAGELAPLRAALELDRFGLVAHVLGDQGCMPDRCDAMMRLRDSSKVLANLRDHTFDEQVKKYTAVWNASKPGEGLVAAAAPPAAPSGMVAPPPGTVAPRYDPPSSSSIPPVSIMAPEAPSPREATASGSAASDVTSQPPPTRPAPQATPSEPPVQAAVVTPVPPRRPPQPRVQRAVAPPQLPPLDAPGTPPPPPGPFR
jgi:hypothetical protein